MKFRKITSLTLLLSGVILLVTSIVLYIVPEGRVAYWSNWKLWGFTKTEWGDHHINSGYLFIIFSIIHIVYNWKPIVNYLKDVKKKIKFSTPEFISAFIIVLVTLFGTQFRIPPFGSVLLLGEHIKDSAAEKYGEPPYGHAELSSLEVFAGNVGVDIEDAVDKLKKAGIDFRDRGQSLKEIAEQNKITPKRIFEVMKPADSENGGKGLPESPEPGAGRLTLQKFAAKYNIPLKTVMDALSENGIDADPGMTLKEAGEKNNIGPADLYEIIRKKIEK